MDSGLAKRTSILPSRERAKTPSSVKTGSGTCDFPNDIIVSVVLSRDIMTALGKAALASGCTPTDYLRATLRSALERSPARLRPDDEAVKLAVNLARDWLDLQTRLRQAGFVFRLVPDRKLALYSWPSNKPLMPIEELGLTKASLVLRFGAAFPGDIRLQATARPRVEAGPPSRVA